jgi:hypothetical protein
LISPAVETVVTDVIEERAPGVITITEFEETEVREEGGSPEPPEETPPESEEQKLRSHEKRTRGQDDALETAISGARGSSSNRQRHEGEARL